ncbi:MAG: hypothetical protein ACYDC2_09935 [Solirubrobacteraceae bacterium]
MLEWVRYVAPDLRIRHDEVLRIEGEEGAECEIRGSICIFTLEGQRFVGSATGENAHDDIVALAYRHCREFLGVAEQQDPHRSRELEQQIVAARRAGQDAIADALTSELVNRNEELGPKPIRRRKPYAPIAPPRPHQLKPAQLITPRTAEPFGGRWGDG